ncbi:alpha-soluble NSF attachment protein isoform X2 [Phymastichus coffea]|uniref:alpha-soluble NSF attachment protein isoform X2 n=1 Tax=Phymastichus coffea TaxID=108790 RepID=UPI00273B77F8|nr:alpha-soluble NSF attachment protein isoform X2 [Phymastichus coffea]
MAENEQKALQLIAEAEKKLTSSKGFLSSLFGGSSKVEDAVECYQRAANLFKMSKKWSEAGNAFCQAANLHAKAGSKHDSATNYIDAANCYKKSDASEAVNCLLKAVEIYTDMGRFTMAAKHHQNIAEIYENEAADLDRAVHHYELASDYFRGEESNSSANKCLLKVAQYAAHLENYEKAIQIYEQVLIENLEEQNAEGFTEAVKEYDSISRLDQWFTSILLRIKKQINDNPDLR